MNVPDWIGKFLKTVVGLDWCSIALLMGLMLLEPG